MKKGSFWVWAGIGAAVLLAVNLLYVARFWGAPLGGPEAYGVFGDFMGGVANPILGFLTILLLVKSLSIQQQTLQSTEQEMKLSREALDLSRQEMERGNDVYQKQLIMQQRYNLRSQLEDHFNRCLQLHEDLFNTSVSAFSPGETVPIYGANTLYQLLSEHFSIGMQLPNWHGQTESRIAHTVRNCSRNVTNAALALIEYTDSLALAEVIRDKAMQQVQTVQQIGIWEIDWLRNVEVRLREAIEARARMEFPPFVQHNRM